MSWSDPRGDLRRLLADTDSDHLIKEKKVFGAIDGSNRTFYTFDDRLLASGYQSVCAKPLRLFYDQAEVAASGIHVTDQLRGEFQVMSMPAAGTEVLASYYYQNHLDTELDFYMQQAVLQMNATSTSNVQDGLQQATLQYAASLAYQRLAERWMRRKSEQWMLHDEPARNAADEASKFYQDMAKQALEMALALRKSFYDLRMDQGRQPAYALLARTPRPYTPRR